MWYGRSMANITRLSTTDYRALVAEDEARRAAPGFTRSLWDQPVAIPHYFPVGSYRASRIEIYREHVDLVRSDTSVSFVTSHLLHGVTKGGKNWYRWDTESKKILTVKPNKQGKMRGNYFLLQRGGSFRNHISMCFHDPFFFNHKDEVDALFEKQMPGLSAKIKERDHEMVYDNVPFYFFPGFLVSEMDQFVAGMPYRLRHALRNETAIEMALDGFGKTHYRKDIVKALASSREYDNVALAMYCRRVLKTDWLVEIMRYGERLRMDTGSGEETNYKRFASIVGKLPVNRRRRFVLSLAGEPAYHNADAVRTAHYLEDEDFGRIRTVPDLHDIGATRQRERIRQPQLMYAADDDWFNPPAYRMPEPVTEIELNDLTKTYHEITTGKGLRIVAPRHADELNEWADYMHNCIGGYSSQADKGTSNLGGVYEGDKLVANFEISKDKILRQLLGRFNQSLDIDVQRDIIDTLLTQDALSTQYISNAWGVDASLAKTLETKDN